MASSRDPSGQHMHSLRFISFRLPIPVDAYPPPRAFPRSPAFFHATLRSTYYQVVDDAYLTQSRFHTVRPVSTLPIALKVPLVIPKSAAAITFRGRNLSQTFSLKLLFASSDLTEVTDWRREFLRMEYVLRRLPKTITLQI